MRKLEGRQNDGMADGSGTRVEFRNDGIASRLREFYGVVEDEGIPDGLLQLLERLDAAEKASTRLQSSKDAIDG